LLLFTLFNSSDVFLLLVMNKAGVSDFNLILAYIFYNLIYALFAYPAGALADKVGFKKMLITGFLLFSLVYAGFAFNSDHNYFFVLLFFYGIYAACSESIGKAWITNITDKSETATAIGAFTAFNSIFTMIASSVAGIIWFYFGAGTTMLISSVAVIFVAIYFIILVPQKAHI